MYVCICNAITDKEIQRAVEDGARDLWDLQGELGVAAGCGSCKEHAMEVVRNVRDTLEQSPPGPQIYEPASA
jgi:bacterioferritin-associated ferredoxin